MSSQIGEKIKISIFGESHGEAIGVLIDNLPSGEKIDEEVLRAFMLRRQGGNNPYSTPRKESDEVKFLSGLYNGMTTGTPLCAIIENNNTRSGDY
ncbi:MAG: chorismate synthase, partial [Clostridia bacterium]|nr:chorismate synthase [Clostridia bacterium]